MQDVICKRLKELEKEKNIRIILIIENGARNWGLESSESDYDVRFMYCYNRDEYLKLKKPKDVIVFKDGLMDFQGFDIYKMTELLFRSNPNVIEILLSNIVYYEAKNNELLECMRDMAKNKYNPVSLFYHYRSMGFDNYEKYIASDKDVTYKRYLYAFRGLFNAIYVNSMGSLPSFNFEKDLEGSNFVPYEIMIVYLLSIIPMKRKGKGKEQIARIVHVDRYLENMFELYKVSKDKIKRIEIPDNLDKLILDEISR
jgi:predicted nucleotidyltransferase